MEDVVKLFRFAKREKELRSKDNRFSRLLTSVARQESTVIVLSLTGNSLHSIDISFENSVSRNRMTRRDQRRTSSRKISMIHGCSLTSVEFAMLLIPCYL